jgi:wyosine [tRNA(Phe)-imidazoG37] synthetase (radical SAM superfamily)
MIAFGPVPSRRLGRSLGINHLPPKTCSYSCVYCQVGRTTRCRDRRSRFFGPDSVVGAVATKVAAVRGAGGNIDYLTFVPEGEPTLDRDLGAMIRKLRPLGIPIAVVTNASLLYRSDVREDLAEADWLSVKVDTVDEGRWRQLNRPHGRLRLDGILTGMRELAGAFRGELVTETMLVADRNDRETELRSTASFVGSLEPSTAYVAVPTRPPAERWVRPAPPAALARAWEVFRALAGRTEFLVGYEGDAFTTTGDPRHDLLAIAAVHPIRERAAARFLGRAGANPDLVAELLGRGDLVRVAYAGHGYLVRPGPAAARVREHRANGS